MTKSAIDGGEKASLEAAIDKQFGGASVSRERKLLRSTRGRSGFKMASVTDFSEQPPHEEGRKEKVRALQ